MTDASLDSVDNCHLLGQWRHRKPKFPYVVESELGLRTSISLPH